MKILLISATCTVASAMFAAAQVPNLINYQGRLTDAGGAPVTGSKNLAISIYDAATGGNLLYTETIGAVTLDANGVYTFQFGSAGTSNTQVTETVATTNGTATTFQKVLDNSPVVAGSVSVTDGTYTWSQPAGSSNQDDFGVAYSTSLRRVTVNYYNGAPAAGQTIAATYRYGTSGITGALSSGGEHWMAISVDGTLQATRQRVLAVPFAQKAATAESLSGGLDFKPYEEKLEGVIYKADESGFVVAYFDDNGLGSYVTASISVGTTAQNLSVVSSTKVGNWAGGSQHTIPIPKGMYWSAAGFRKVYFVAFTK